MEQIKIERQQIKAETRKLNFKWSLESMDPLHEEENRKKENNMRSNLGEILGVKIPKKTLTNDIIDEITIHMASEISKRKK